MENLTASVYECTLGVEAHMICDLLARAGISARVDGEFLAGAGGELPLGNTIKVRVGPAKVAEAREVIDEWQRLQPVDPTPAPPPTRKKRIWSSTLWFAGGVIAGGAVMFLALRTPYTTQSADVDGDDIVDETYFYSGDLIARIDYDRNADGKVDARWKHDVYGVPVQYQADDDFDGHFEWQGNTERGSLERMVKDADGDGRPERVLLAKHGVVDTVEIYDDGGDRVVVRERFDNARLLSSEYDKDGDGVFERKVEYDRYGEPIAR